MILPIIINKLPFENHRIAPHWSIANSVLLDFFPFSCCCFFFLFFFFFFSLHPFLSCPFSHIYEMSVIIIGYGSHRAERLKSRWLPPNEITTMDSHTSPNTHWLDAPHAHRFGQREKKARITNNRWTWKWNKNNAKNIFPFWWKEVANIWLFAVWAY